MLIPRWDFLLIITLALLGICPVRCDEREISPKSLPLLKLSRDYFRHPPERDRLSWSSVILPVGCFQDLSAGQEEICSSLCDSEGECCCQVFVLLYLLCACRIEMTCFYSNEGHLLGHPRATAFL